MIYIPVFATVTWSARRVRNVILKDRGIWLWRHTTGLWWEESAAGHLWKGPVTRTLIISLMSVSTNCWINRRVGSDLIRHGAHCSVISMSTCNKSHVNKYQKQSPYVWYMGWTVTATIFLILTLQSNEKFISLKSWLIYVQQLPANWQM